MKSRYKLALVIFAGLVLFMLPSTIGVVNKELKTPLDVGVEDHLTDAKTESIYTATAAQSPKTSAQSSAIMGTIVNGEYKFTSFECWKEYLYVSSCWQPITNYNFTLPQASYVYVESSGLINGHSGLAVVALGIDNPDPVAYDMKTYRAYQGGWLNDTSLGYPYITPASTGFQTGRIYYLTAGKHTVYLNGLVTRKNVPGEMYATPTMSGISISVIINQKGELTVTGI